MLDGAIGKLKGWLLQNDKPPIRALRNLQPDIVVHYWDGSAPDGRHLRDISESGAYIYTPERWYPGTIIRLVLQGYQTRTLPDGTTVPVASTCIPARVVREGPDGVAVEFVFRNREEGDTLKAFLSAIPVQPAMAVPPR